MRINDWTSEIPDGQPVAALTILSIGEAIEGFTPNITVAARELPVTDGLEELVELGRIVEGEGIESVEMTPLEVDGQPMVMQRYTTTNTAGRRLLQSTLFFVAERKGVIATLSVPEVAGTSFDRFLFSLASHFCLISTDHVRS